MAFTQEQQNFLRTEFALKGRIMFPNLLRLKKKDKLEDRDIYDTMFVLDPRENANTIAQINNFIAQCNQIAHQGIIPAAILPIWKAYGVQGYPDYVKQNGQPNPDYLKGFMWVNASTGRDLPPAVYKQTSMGLLKLTENDDAEVYSGRNAVISINFWPMLPKPESKNQKRGYYINVKGVLLQEGGDRLGGAPDLDPNKTFGSFLQDMGAQPNFGGFGTAPQGAPQAPTQQQAPQGQHFQQNPWGQAPQGQGLPPMGNGFAPNNGQWTSSTTAISTTNMATSKR